MRARWTGRLAGALAAAGLLAGDAAAQLNCDPGVEFHPGGGIRSCQLNGEHRFRLAGGRELVCASGRTIELHPAGEVKRCTLGAPWTDPRAPCPAGARIELDPSGAATACRRD